MLFEPVQVELAPILQRPLLNLVLGARLDDLCKVDTQLVLYSLCQGKAPGMYRLTVPVILLVRRVNAEVDVATTVGASLQAPLLSLLLLPDLAKIIIIPDLINL